MKNTKRHVPQHQNKIAYLVSCYPTLSHTFILREIQSLRQRGVEVEIVSIREPQNPFSLGLEEQQELKNTYYLLSKPKWKIAGLLVKSLLKNPLSSKRIIGASMSLAAHRKQPFWKTFAYAAEAIIICDYLQQKQVSHIHNHFGNAAGTVTYLLSRTEFFEFSLSIHGPDVFFNVDRELFPEKLVEAKFIRTISHFCESQLRAISGIVNAEHMKMVRCGVDPSRYRPSLKNPMIDRPRILCVGRLCAVKEQFLLLTASRQMADSGLDHELVIVGDGPTAEKLQRHVRSMKLEGHVRMLGGLSQDEVLEEYRRADIFVLPSCAEGIPVVLMEAMAMELPVISTHVAGIPELIDHEQNGLLFPAGDKDALVDRLQRLIRSKSLRMRLGNAARMKIQSDFNLHGNTQKLAEIFEATLQGKAA